MKYFIDYKLKCLKDRICPMLNEANVMSTAFFPQYVSSLPEDRGAKPPLLPLWPSSLPRGTEVCMVWISDQRIEAACS